MYYKSVNRGLSFTKAGVYSVSFVVAIGLLAIVSGVNGLYLYLSLGLSILIVSGILSEQVMKYSKVRKLDEIIVDANTEFDLKFSIENTSTSHTLFGIDVYFLGEKPKIGLVGGLQEAAISGTVKRIPPNCVVESVAKSNGLVRGAYQKFFVYQNTKYPFGLLEKFKFSSRKSSVVVVPKVDSNLFSELSVEAKSWLDDRSVDKQFFSHKPYEHQDSRKAVDWKRSANLPVKQWVTKEYRADTDHEKIVVEFGWSELFLMNSEQEYELLLERVRTPFAVFEKIDVEMGLQMDGGVVIWGRNNIYRALADMPRFEEKPKVYHLKEFASDQSGEISKIMINANQWTWGTVSESSNRVTS